MTSPPMRFQVVFWPLQQRGRQVLHTLTDPNEATLAFQAALATCQMQGEWGELVLVNQGSEQTPLLRYPVSPPAAFSRGGTPSRPRARVIAQSPGEARSELTRARQ